MNSFNKHSFVVSLLFVICTHLCAQDTLKIKRPERGDEYCWPVIFVKENRFTDSLPQKMVSGENVLELQINDECPVKKRADVFISSFEIYVEDNGKTMFSTAQSSFFTGRQKKIIQQLKPGNSFWVRNILVHGPDGFRKIDNFKVTLN